MDRSRLLKIIGGQAVTIDILQEGLSQVTQQRDQAAAALDAATKRAQVLELELMRLKHPITEQEVGGENADHS